MPGDVVTVEIDGIGALTNRVVAASGEAAADAARREGIAAETGR